MPDQDPVRLANWLREPLASDKTALAILLGAGCPCALKNAAGTGTLIPAIRELTTHTRDRILAEHPAVASVLLQQFSDDGNPNATVEEILSHIRTLREVAGKGTVRGLTASQLDTLDTCICNEIVTKVDQRLPSGDNPYRSLATWARQPQRARALEFFTTNYDLLLEEALEDARLPYFDGFLGSRHTFFDADAIEHDTLPATWARLWKIHGSIHWYQTKDGHVYRSLQPDGGERRVIHPSNLKYTESRLMPYLAMLDRLRAFLRQPACFLFTTGYSFSDQHLNEIILNGLQTNPTATVVGLVYGPLVHYNLIARAAPSHRNLMLLGQDEGILSGQRGPWRTQNGATSPAPYVVATGSTPGAATASWEMRLGDFSEFGALLADIAGRPAI